MCFSRLIEWPEHTLIEVLEGWLSVDVVCDPGPIVATTVAGSPFRKLCELAGCVASVVPSLTSATFPLS